VRWTVGDNRYVCSVTARTSFFRSSSLFAFVLRTLDIARENRLSRLEKFQRQGRKRTHVYFSFLFNRDWIWLQVRTRWSWIPYLFFLSLSLSSFFLSRIAFFASPAGSFLSTASAHLSPTTRRSSTEFFFQTLHELVFLHAVEFYILMMLC